MDPPAKDKLESANLSRLWDDLAGETVPAAKAVARLAAQPEKALALLKEKLRPAEVPDRKKILKLIDDLDDDTFVVRETAMRDLEKTLPPSVGLLREALATTQSLEIKNRLQRLLEPFEEETSLERLRQRRVLQAIERMNTAEARKLLETLAKGPKGVELTDEAATALRRRK